MQTEPKKVLRIGVVRRTQSACFICACANKALVTQMAVILIVAGFESPQMIVIDAQS